MKEHPILFSTELIPKILDGTKTQTRRLTGLKEINKEPDAWCISGHVGDEWGFGNLHGEDDIIIKCPYGQVGDKLWVRETFWAMADGKTIYYKATVPFPNFPFSWKPSIHMPRWASRITLEITEVRVQKVQEISLADIEAEGHKPFVHLDGMRELSVAETYSWFMNLWDSLNAKRGYGWEVNPWVWAISFRRLDGKT